MKAARVFPVFSATFAAIYLAAMYFNLALVSYFPRLKQWYWLTVTDLPRSAGPGMYWYGWLLTSLLGAGAVAVLALALPPQPVARAASLLSWAVPLGAIVVILYILRGWFLH